MHFQSLAVVKPQDHLHLNKLISFFFWFFFSRLSCISELATLTSQLQPVVAVGTRAGTLAPIQDV
jgi:hypothetical protein